MAKKRLFSIGDGVQLRSGSPHMTVVGWEKGGHVKCCWFDEDEKERRSIFPAAALIPEQVDDLTDDELKTRVGIILAKTNAKPR